MMPRFEIRVRSVRVALAAMFVAISGIAAADDTEVFFINNTEVIKPNIVFILDTSGSMDDSGKYGAPYDPGETYAGPCTDATLIYYRTASSTTVPNCDPADDNYLHTGKFKCAAADLPLATTGYYVDRMQEWRVFASPYWGDLYNNTRDSECMADDGAHGATTSDPKVYAATGAADGPYTSNAASAGRIDWPNRKAFKVYSKNYMNWYHTVGNVTMRKIDVIKSVMSSVLSSVNNVNVGLMQLSGNMQGGMVVYHVASVNDRRAELLGAVDAIEAMESGGGTPLAEALWEAMRYFQGGKVDQGLASQRWQGGPSGGLVDFPSVATSRSSSDTTSYLSPVELGCQRCILVLLTDGEPTSDRSRDSQINALPGFAALNPRNPALSGDRDGCDFAATPPDNCVDEMARYLRNTDLRTDLGGVQRLLTYTVGFDFDDPLLQITADNGGGRYFTTRNTAELANALTQIIVEVLEVNTSFTAPTVSISAFNRTQHSNDVFFTMFKPNTGTHWDGNLKKYRFASVSGQTEIVDATGATAVDPGTGYFKDDAKSFWSDPADPPDGQEVVAGGVAARLGVSRRLYTWLGGVPALDAAANALAEGNGAITAAMVGAADAAERSTNLDWAVGLDVGDLDYDGDVGESRRRMGDPLHSKPAVVTYRTGLDEVEPLLYFGTNDGLLHAVSGSSGEERFAFMPPDLLPNLQSLRSGAGAKVYGLDGPVTALLEESTHDQVIDRAAGEAALLVVGMRRGGRNYYALDVTDPDHPQLDWIIAGGSGAFVELGQSWSRAVPLKIKLGGVVRQALAFGGGYDDGQDSASTSIDAVGRAVYLVDADTGARLWWAGPSGSGADLELAALTNAIPADLRVIDLNGDGLADRIYAADMGGRLWRFDIRNDATTSADLVVGGTIANLGQGGISVPVLADNRRFFSAPDVTLVVGEGAPSNFLAINIGSGYRAHPLDKRIDDMFFSVRDPFIFDTPPSFDYGVTVGTLYDATANVLGEGTDAERTAALNQLYATYKGWYLRLDEGEKTLAEAVTFDEKVMFTTYTPSDPGAAVAACLSDPGRGRLYIVAQRTATPVVDLQATPLDPSQPGLDSADRSIELMHRGIAAEAAILFPEASSGQPEVFVGTERAPIDLGGKRLVRTYWREAGR